MTPTLRRGDGDRGAVAVVVALTVTLVLVPVAALAVDLGAVYVRQESLQQVAETAATAAAAELAAVQRTAGATADAVRDAARAQAVAALCAASGGNGDDAGWHDRCSGSHAWAADGDDANGEVSFYTGRPSLTDHVFDPLDGDAGGAAPGDRVSGVRVVTPPSRVTMGLSGVFGRSHTDPQRAATAGIFTVLPAAGFLPMFLTPGELASPTNRGGFCARSGPASIWQTTHPGGRACDPLYSGSIARGYLTAPRTSASENGQATLWNTATGFDPQHLPLPGGALTLAPQLSPASALVRDLSPGLFSSSGGTPGRLRRGECPRGSYDQGIGPYPGQEGAFLADFTNPRVGDRSGLRSLVWSGAHPADGQQGWLDPGILRCGRLAAVPVIGGIASLLPYQGLPGVSYPVVGLRLVWLDDRFWAGEPSSERVATSSGPCLHRGFYWASGSDVRVCPTSPWALRAYTGYVLDPLLLPATVAGPDAANVLDEYLGQGLPVTVRLLRDVDDPPAS